MLIVSEQWKNMYPGAVVGILAMHNVANPASHAGLDRCKQELEDRLRTRFAGYDKAKIKMLPVLQAYNAYYKRYSKSYHVQLQLESVVLKGKSLPRTAALVDAMFVAELDNLLLTAGHDLDTVTLPLTLDVADGTERYLHLSGQEQMLKSGDMRIADARGVLSCIIGGPDQRTRITPQTRNVLFTVYAPAGIGKDAVRKHLQDIQMYVALIAPDANTSALEVFSAS